MGHVLHGSARTTAAVRRAIQHSQVKSDRLVKQFFSIFSFLIHIGLDFCSPSANAVDGCYKTWKYTAVHLVGFYGRWVVPPANPFLFETAFDTFCYSIVETITDAAHATHKAVDFQQAPVLRAGCDPRSGYVQSIQVMADAAR